MIAKHIGQTINCSLQTWMVGMFYLLLYLLEKKKAIWITPKQLSMHLDLQEICLSTKLSLS